MLKIYNTLSRQKQVFKPIQPGKIGMYVCGMTVYDYCHIGHARVLIVFDTVARYLRYSGYELTYVRNITDIDDKIILRAKENKEDYNQLTQRFIDAMHEDEQALHVLPPDQEPRATTSIGSILDMISALIEKGLAYQGSNGDIFYSVEKFENYGQLSGKNLADLQAGERVSVDQAKQNPLDFVLWKMAKPDEPSWDSPWGAGRPGWHIECSAMSTKCLGDHFDIHGGGMDLQFPHHENEIAQSEGSTRQKFVNVWMHNGFVRVNEEKMSKSLGNFFTVRTVLQRYRSEVVRFFILSSHYRSPLNYSDEHLDEANAALSRLYNALRCTLESDIATIDASYEKRFKGAMDDDFNTPVAMAVLFDIARDLNRAKDAEPHNMANLAATLRLLGHQLGLLQEDPEVFLKSSCHTDESVSDEEIERLIQARLEAKLNKDWGLADEIRDQLKAQSIVLEDVPGGQTHWRRGSAD